MINVLGEIVYYPCYCRTCCYYWYVKNRDGKEICPKCGGNETNKGTGDKHMDQNGEIKACSECQTYFPNKGNHGATGQCRLNPPTVFPNPVRKPITNEIAMSQIQFLPLVTEDHWCGQFKKRGQ